MTCSCSCAGTASQFDRRRALQERARYERRGPDSTTRLILEELRPVARPGDTLLDIGGGIGVLDLELHQSIGLGESVLVDAAPDSVAVARELSDRSAEPARFRAIAGDFTEISPPVTADIVTFVFENLVRRLKGNPFRTFVHPPAAIRQILGSAGLRRAGQRSTVVWLVESWDREDTPRQGRGT